MERLPPWLAISVTMTPDAGSPSPQPVPIAVIIRRDLASVAAHLRDEFSGVASLVAVIIDRRYRERRHAETGAQPERRQRERRRRDVAAQLRDGGWAVVPLGDSDPHRE